MTKSEMEGLVQHRVSNRLLAISQPNRRLLGLADPEAASFLTLLFQKQEWKKVALSYAESGGAP